MALNKNQLSKVGNLNSVAGAATSRQFWHYDGGADNVAAVIAAGYFNEVRGFLGVGDVILAVASDGFRVLNVTAVPKTGNVTVGAKAAA